ncbi:hypothetical protein M413DRAFT_32345 [Hebeloma cylindrosporum]|uniref:Rab-GAP TBC domain-containing protein n=1 Tax=Hebeloma cylindrosporum TaxID=76867 RepID=A0A0C3BWC4_HEBCY|nr:hypothetical protein M413DRAFT_32345 [Hebeloma cylindrosporum h7]
MHSDEPHPTHVPKHRQPEVDWEGLRVRSLQKGGFGEDRVDIWPKLLHVSKQKATKDKKSFDATLEDEKPPHQDERQIGLDTDRSFVLYPVEPKLDREALQAGLHELLISLFRKRPQLSYFQGYHDIITVLFLTLPPELHSVCVEKLSLHRLRDSMGLGLEPVLGLLRVTKNLLDLADPTYAQVLEQTSPLPFYSLSNLLTLFSHDVPTLPLIQHIFDYLFCRPPIAAVYLAAAIILSRKAEVMRLQEEDEDGMIHSLLSSLPNLVDDADMVDAEEIKTEREPSPWIKEESTAAHDNTFFKEDGELNVSTADAIPQLEADAEDGGSPDDFLDGANAPSDGRCGHSLILADEPENLPDTGGADTVAPMLDDPPSDFTEQIPNDDENPSSKRSPSTPELPPSEDTSSAINPIKFEKSETPPPTLPPHAQLAKLVLTDLLKLADDLYDKYPPSHSMLALSSIMGPQSVVFTWSESLSALPSDNTAEAMVSHPELVVYPYIEVNPYQKETDEEEKEGRSKTARRKRRNKLKKSPFGHLEKKTVLAGTVIVLGVAVAIYGIKARNGPGSHGLFQTFADGHRTHGNVARDWKRVGGWVGGTLAGVSQKIMNGLSPDS